MRQLTDRSVLSHAAVQAIEAALTADSQQAPPQPEGQHASAAMPSPAPITTPSAQQPLDRDLPVEPPAMPNLGTPAVPAATAAEGLANRQYTVQGGLPEVEKQPEARQQLNEADVQAGQRLRAQVGDTQDSAMP